MENVHLFYGGSGQHFAKTLLEKMVHIPRHFSFLLRVQGNVWQRLQDAYKFRREITVVAKTKTPEN